MSDPLSLVVGVSALAKVGVDFAKREKNIEKTPFGVTYSRGLMNETSFVIDDSSSGASTVWSANRIKSEIQSRKGLERPVHEVGNVVLFGLADSGIRFDDSHTADPRVLWSSLRVNGVFENRTRDRVKLSPGNANAVVFSADGEPIGSLYPVDDASNKPTAIWSADKVTKVLTSSAGMKTGPADKKNQIAVFDKQGQVVPDPAVPMSSTELGGIVRRTLINKTPTIVANQRNLAGFNTDGSLNDSGAYVDSTKTASNIVWPSSRVQMAVDTISEAAASKTQELISAANQKPFSLSPLSAPDAATKMALRPTAASGNIARFDGSGQAVDSTMRLNDAFSSTNDVWSALKTTQALEALAATPLKTTSVAATSSLADLQNAINAHNATALTKMPKLAGSTTLNAAAFDSRGGLADGGFVLDDTKQGIDNAWSSSKFWDYLSASSAAVQKQLADTNLSATNLEKLLSNFQNLQPSAAKDNIAVFDKSGQLVDSNSTPTLSASYIFSEMTKKAAGSGTNKMLATWESPTTLSSSAVAVDDAVFTTGNVLTADAIANMDPWATPVGIDPIKIYAIYKLENYTHPGPYWLSYTGTRSGNANNWKVPPWTVVESNFTTPPSRATNYRIALIGAATSPVDSIFYISGERNRREDMLIPANSTIPIYYTGIYKDSVNVGKIAFLPDPGPVTVLFATLCIVEL